MTPLSKAPRVRVDAGSGRGSELAPGRGSLLRAFGAWGGDGAAAGRSRGRVLRPGRPETVAAVERRVNERHHVECLAWVGWKTWRRFHMRDTLVINLSRGGALVFLDEPPPADRPVWVFLETPARNAIVQARVLDIRRTSSGQCAARVAFDELCPYDVFEAAVCGLTPADPRRRIASRVKAPARPAKHAD